MKIAEAAARCGLSIDTIRYYEKSGLTPAIARGSDGVRRFSPENVEWLTLLASLRQTGMQMAEMRRFAALYREGDAAIPQRRTLLLEHSDRLERRRTELDQCATLLAYKLQKYSEMENR